MCGLILLCMPLDSLWISDWPRKKTPDPISHSSEPKLNVLYSCKVTCKTLYNQIAPTSHLPSFSSLTHHLPLFNYTLLPLPSDCCNFCWDPRHRTSYLLCDSFSRVLSLSKCTSNNNHVSWVHAERWQTSWDNEYVKCMSYCVPHIRQDSRMEQKQTPFLSLDLSPDIIIIIKVNFMR